MKTVSRQSQLIVIILFFDLILNIIIQLIPNSIKLFITRFSSFIGLSYTIFWFLLTTIIVLIILFISIKKIRIEETKDQLFNKEGGKRVVNQYGSKSIYIEKSERDINIK